MSAFVEFLERYGLDFRHIGESEELACSTLEDMRTLYIALLEAKVAHVTPTSQESNIRTVKEIIRDTRGFRAAAREGEECEALPAQGPGVFSEGVAVLREEAVRVDRGQRRRGRDICG